MAITTTRWWLCVFVPVMLVLSCFLIYKSIPSAPAAKKLEPINPDWYSVETARGDYLKSNPIVGNCFICHAYWVPIPKSEQTSKPRLAHANITLNHGKNDRCYNCHMISDRNKYVADDGSGIMSQLPEELCSRCHGLIYNDWQAGTHGKWVGMWNSAKKSSQSIFTCTECHDPHNPKYTYKTLAPPPIWPEKYIRTKIEDSHSGPFSNFFIDEEPKEIF